MKKELDGNSSLKTENVQGVRKRTPSFLYYAVY